MDNIGGAEMVSLVLARELNAEIITTNIDEAKIKMMGFDDIRIKSIGSVPINAPFRQQIASFRFTHHRFGNSYDFYIICGDWAVSAAINNHPNLWYVHSPIREIYDLYDYTRRNIVPFGGRSLFWIWAQINRGLNRRYVQHVDRLVTNSQLTQSRVKTYLNRSANVIHPPIDTSQFTSSGNGSYLLSVNRLITHKRVLMQIEAMRHLPNERLIVVGCFEKSRHFQRCARQLRASLPANVELRSFVPRSELIQLYADAKLVLCTSVAEDFGMTAVEAMAAGKPVIASSCGGYRESILDGQTGKLLHDLDVPKLVQAISEVASTYLEYRDACLQRAAEFDTSRFIEKMNIEIQASINQVAEFQPHTLEAFVLPKSFQQQ